LVEIQVDIVIVERNSCFPIIVVIVIVVIIVVVIVIKRTADRCIIEDRAKITIHWAKIISNWPIVVVVVVWDVDVLATTAILRNCPILARINAGITTSA